MKKLQILGTGCPRCKKLAELTEEAAQSLGVAYEIEKITDLKKILASGVMMTPALAVNGEVKVSGRIPNLEEIKKFIVE